MEKILVPNHKQFLAALTVVQTGLNGLRKPLTTVARPAANKFGKMVTPVNDLIRWTTANQEAYTQAVAIARGGTTAPKAKAAHT